MTDRVVPITDSESAPYWEAAANGRLVVKGCRDCGARHWYPRAHCPRCGSPETEWVHSAGRGRIHSYTTIHRAQQASFRDRVPYTLALVDLDEGPRILGFLDGGAGVTVGTAVTAGFEPVGDTALVSFRVDTGD